MNEVLAASKHGAALLQAGHADRLLTVQEVARRLNVAVGTLYGWRHMGRGPRAVKLGAWERAPLRYRVADLEAWLREPAAEEARWRRERGGRGGAAAAVES